MGLKLMDVWNRVLEFFVLPVAALGSFLVIFPLSVLLLGQPNQASVSDSDFKIHELEKKADKEDNQIERLAISLEGITQRLIVLETLQKGGTNEPWQRGTSVGTGLLLVEAAFRISVKKIERERKKYAEAENEN